MWKVESMRPALTWLQKYKFKLTRAYAKAVAMRKERRRQVHGLLGCRNDKI